MTHAGEEALERFVVETSEAVGRLLSGDKQYPNQAIIILYSAIDAAGLLEAPAQQVSASRASFTVWCEQHVIRTLSVKCAAIDLYAARCAVLHAHGSESDLSRSGAAKEVAYLYGDPASSHYQEQARWVESVGSIPIHIGEFACSVLKGLGETAALVGPMLRTDSERNARAMRLIRGYSLLQLAAAGPQQPVARPPSP